MIEFLAIGNMTFNHLIPFERYNGIKVLFIVVVVKIKIGFKLAAFNSNLNYIVILAILFTSS